MLAAHKTERGPGQLPAEGVVLIGVDLELQRRMAEGIASTTPPQQQPKSDPGPTGAPNFDAPDLEASAPAPPAGAGATPNRLSGILDKSGEASQDETNAGAPEFSAPKFDLRELLLRRTPTKTYTVHPVSRIEDVFTSAERDLLRWLWEKGRPLPVTQRIRLAMGPNGEGARRLAVQAGLIYNTFKNLTRSLATKFALDIVKPEKNLPAIYAIYHYSAILERQRQAGFTGAVHKNGGGRELVDAHAQPAPRRPDLTIAELESILGAPNFGAPNSASRAPKFGAVSGNFGAPNFGGTIRNKEYTPGKENTSPSAPPPNSGAPTIVVDALFERTGRTDSDAARLIAKGCLEANPTVQPEEIARLIRTAPIPPNIANPVGLLIRALPSRCAPESLANYRDRWRQEAEQEKRRREQERAQAVETARSILDSISKGEEWDAASIDWARSILAETAGSHAATG